VARAVHVRIQEFYAGLAATLPSWWRKFPETVVITSARGLEIEVPPMDAQGRQTVVVRGPQGAGMHVDRSSRWNRRE
jgi:hypothetical protein